MICKFTYPSKFQAPICRIAAAVAAAAAADKWQGGVGAQRRSPKNTVTTGHPVTVQKNDNSFTFFALLHLGGAVGLLQYLLQIEMTQSGVLGAYPSVLASVESLS